MIRSLIFFVLLASLNLTACAQSQPQEVPFVGCPGDGQTGPVAAPTGRAQRVKLEASTASQLAFYEASGPSGSLSVLAPRGWSCFYRYGSSGSFLVVAPATGITNAPRPGIASPGVVVNYYFGDTSGRFIVADYAARLFLETERDYVQRVIDEGLVPKENFSLGPYPDDILRYRSDTLVEFETPAHRKGIGNSGQESSEPIYGLASLDDPGDEPNLFLLTIRLPPEQRGLRSAIMAPFEEAKAK